MGDISPQTPVCAGGLYFDRRFGPDTTGVCTDEVIDNNMLYCAEEVSGSGANSWCWNDCLMGVWVS